MPRQGPRLSSARRARRVFPRPEPETRPAPAYPDTRGSRARMPWRARAREIRPAGGIRSGACLAARPGPVGKPGPARTNPRRPGFSCCGVSARSGINPAWLQIHRVPGTGFEDHLQQRLGVQVIETDRLADPALHQDLGAEVVEMLLGRIRFGGGGAHHGDVMQALAVSVEPFLIYAGSL